MFPRLLIPPPKKKKILLLYPISRSTSHLLSASFFPPPLLPLIVGYRCSPCLSFKDYLCSHLDEGFGKGSLSASSFRGAPEWEASTRKEACVRLCSCVSVHVCCNMLECDLELREPAVLTHAWSCSMITFRIQGLCHAASYKNV